MWLSFFTVAFAASACLSIAAVMFQTEGQEESPQG